MQSELNPNAIEFRCHYCGCWFEPAQTEPHFSSAHEQAGVTFEILQTRLASLGGLDTRDRVVASNHEEDLPTPVKTMGNWIFPHEDDEYFETNNFQHPRD